MAEDADPFDLGRFVVAQAPAIEQAFAELRAGRKTSHWIWFVFPQLAGLGRSAMAQRYAIGSLEEARAYLAHELLGPRLRQGVALALAWRAKTARDLFGAPDDLKFHSCLTLFQAADPDEPLFAEALDAFFDGLGDPVSLEILAGQA